jgi:TRAP-type C4-dicarboxylate transport system permease small subunit
MTGFVRIVFRLSKFLNVIAGITLILMMLLTVADVFLRSFRKPIPGTYELVSLSLGVVISFSVPFTSWIRKQIYVDFLITKFPDKVIKAFNICTRLLGIWLFLMVGSYLIRMGNGLWKSGEVTLTLKMPFYPVAYAIGICCFVQCFVLLCDIVKVIRGEYE